ncbi:MAG: aspartate aminotransferase family protein [Flammeovirgaceae bacterium]|nr:aspartate aminotransferase family protein [Flammeovirgaceae bacterium]
MDTKKYNLENTIFAWSNQKGLDPIHVKKAEGVHLYDENDKRYIDFSSQLMNVNIGHGRQEVTEAVTRQMEKLSYVCPPFTTDSRGILGKKLADITPNNINKTFFTLGGAESNENAIILARLYTQKHKIITHYRSYHGATIGSVSAGGDPRKNEIDSQQVPNFIHVENPYYYRCPWYSSSFEECGERSIKNLEKTINYEGANNIAAIMMEGESGTSGCIKYPPFYLKKVEKLCKKYDLLLIIDEVMSGFCRTGEWFGFDNHSIKPDIISIAKGVTSGYIPLGGIMVSDDIINSFDDKILPLGLTYSAHSVACAAAVAVLDIYENENIIENVKKIGNYTDKKIEKLMRNHPSLGDWRNTGMLGCIELVKNKKSKDPLAPFNATPKQMKNMNKVIKVLREEGMFTYTKWNYIFIAPPLTSTKDDIDEGIEIISKALKVADEFCY